MQTLDLYIKYGFGINFYAVMRRNVIGKYFFIVLFDSYKSVKDRLVSGVMLQIL